MKHSTNLITIEIGLNRTYLETNLYTGGHTIFFIVDPQLQKSRYTKAEKHAQKYITRCVFNEKCAGKQTYKTYSRVYNIKKTVEKKCKV